MKEQHMIGFSLSLCIKDILNGKVNIDEVLFIQTGCNPVNSMQVEDILEQYCRNYWSKDPAKARSIFETLYNDHRIGWTSGYVKNCCNIAWGFWLSTENAVLTTR